MVRGLIRTKRCTYCELVVSGVVVTGQLGGVKMNGEYLFPATETAPD